MNADLTGPTLSLLLATVLPLVVGLVTKRSWNAGLKATVLAALSALTAFCTVWAVAVGSDIRFSWQVAVLSSFGTFLAAMATHYQIFKPTGISAAVQRVGISDPVAPTSATVIA